MKDILMYDVVVVGGGSAGIAAATGAARAGAKVALLESHSFLGGKATASYVGTVCGFYLRSEEQVPKFASNGFSREFEEKLKNKCKTKPQSNKNGLWFLPYHAFDFKRLCDGLVIENKIDLYLHTVLCNVNLDDGNIHTIRTISYDREVIFKPGAVIDCTGEAMVSKLAGTEVIECDEYQSSAQVFNMEGLQETETAVLSLLIIRELRKALEKGNIDAAYENISIIPGSHFNNRISIKIGIPEKVSNEINKITPIELIAREMVENAADFLIRKVDPFKNAYISSIAPEAGVRTGRRAFGKNELTEEHVLHCIKFEDGIANGAWPVEHWALGKRVNMQYFAADNYYQVPAGCLISKNIRNLYFAGRHISATNMAIASARVIGSCLGTGYAAGKLAAFVLNGSSSSDAIKVIRKEQVDL